MYFRYGVWYIAQGNRNRNKHNNELFYAWISRGQTSAPIVGKSNQRRGMSESFDICL